MNSNEIQIDAKDQYLTKNKKFLNKDLTDLDYNTTNKKPIPNYNYEQKVDKDDSMVDDINTKFNDLSNLEDNMKKLNEVLETSIKSSYRMRYEFNLNDYKKNFTSELNIPKYEIKEYDTDHNNTSLRKNLSEANEHELKNRYEYKNSNSEIAHYANQDPLSKKFYSEKNGDLKKNNTISTKKNSHKTENNNNNNNNFTKEEKFQYAYNLNNNTNSNFAAFENCENDYQNNVVNKKSKGNNSEYNQILAEGDEMNENDFNEINYVNNNKNIQNIQNFQEPTFRNTHFIDKPNNAIYNSNICDDVNYNNYNVGKHKNPKISNHKINNNYQSFNVDKVLKTADEIGKSKENIITKNIKDENRKRIEIPRKVYDMQKIEKKNFDKDNKGYFYSELEQNKDEYYYNSLKNYEIEDINETNLMNNTYFSPNASNPKGKKEEDEFDYIKNLLVKTQIDIQSFNKEFDNESGDIKNYSNMNRNHNSKNNFKNKEENQSINKYENNNIYVQDTLQEHLPRKQPKPVKPFL